MQTDSSPNPTSSDSIITPTRITMVDGEQQLLQPLYQTLKQQGYQPHLFFDADEALAHLSKTDILLLDVSIAQQPKSSKFIKVPTILVLSDNKENQLPPWLQARHVFLVHHPQDPQTLVARLADYLPPRTPDFDIAAYNNQHLALLFGITQFLSGHLNINDLFERILALTPYLGAQFSALLVMEDDEIIYYRSTQPGREELTGPAGRRFAGRLLKDGLEGWTLQHNQATVVLDTKADPRWFRAPYLPDHAHCVAVVPFNISRVKAQGVYLIGHRDVAYFSEEDIPLLQAATNQIGLAIENAMLFKNQTQRSMQLALINQVSQAATSILNLDVMLRTVVQAIRRSLACYSVAIHLYNQKTNLVELKARDALDRPRYRTPDQPTLTVTHELKQGLIGWAIATNQTVLANDVTRDDRYVPDDANKEIRSQVCVPITLGIKTIGVLDLQSAQLEAFNKYHVDALKTLADQLAIAIENARLYDEINQRVQELKSLNEIGQAVTSTLNLKETLTLITDQTTRLMEVAAASVALRDESGQEIWFAAASGEGSGAAIGLRMAYGQGIAGWVVSHGEPVIVPDVNADVRFFAEVDKQSGFTTKSILCVPLITKGHTIGALEVMNKQQGTFNQEDLALLQALAAPAATAIENAQLYEKERETINRLAETQYQLIQSAKLAAVGELAAGVAHEINNPLTTIIGLTGVLQDTLPTLLPDQPEVTEDLQMVYEEARRARDIVRHLLDFARAEPPKLLPTDFNQLVEDAIFLVYPKNLSQKIQLRKSLSDLPEMWLDANQIKQVLVNLLNNAIQAMLETNQPAVLTVTTQYQLSNGSQPDHSPAIVCTISDTGAGISPEYIDKIFDPFFTTKEVGEGTGLGLSISYKIIEKHGGSIEVSSALYQGTTFILTLPVSYAPNSTPNNDSVVTKPVEIRFLPK